VQLPRRCDDGTAPLSSIFARFTRRRLFVATGDAGVRRRFPDDVASAECSPPIFRVRRVA
jgi:hypothetical protein